MYYVATLTYEIGTQARAEGRSAKPLEAIEAAVADSNTIRTANPAQVVCAVYLRAPGAECLTEAGTLAAVRGRYLP